MNPVSAHPGEQRGFASSFVVMALSGFVAGALILLGIQATGRSLETTVDRAG